MPEMIVEHNESIVDDIVWQNGVLLRAMNRGNEVLALLKVDYQERELRIWLQGQDAKEVLSILRAALNKILTRLSMQTAEWIRLPAFALIEGSARPQQEDWANYAQIEMHQRMGKTEYISSSGQYNLVLVVGLYLSAQENIGKGGDVYQIIGQNNQIFPRSMGISNQTITISDSTVQGAVNVTGKIEEKEKNNNVNIVEITQLLQELLNEINLLKKSVPKIQSTLMDDIKIEQDAIEKEKLRTPPRKFKLAASLKIIFETTQLMGPIGDRVAKKAAILMGILA